MHRKLHRMNFCVLSSLPDHDHRAGRIHLEGLSQVWYPAGAHPHCRVRIFPADTLSFCLILFSHRSSIRKLHIVNMPFCSALFLKTAIKAAEFFEHLIILSRGLAPSSPLSFCQSFPCVFLLVGLAAWGYLRKKACPPA